VGNVFVSLMGFTQEGVRFVFGFDAYKPMIERAEDVDDREYRKLVRKADEVFEGRERAKQPRVKEQIVKERGYHNLRLEREDVAVYRRAESSFFAPN